MRARLGTEPLDLEPKASYRLIGSWLELAVPFIVNTHGVCRIDDAMSRHNLTQVGAAGIGTATYDIAGLSTITPNGGGRHAWQADI